MILRSGEVYYGMFGLEESPPLLYGAHSQRRITDRQETEIRLQASVANARRELAIMAREHEVFPNPAGTKGQTPQGGSPAKGGQTGAKHSVGSEYLDRVPFRCQRRTEYVST